MWVLFVSFPFSLDVFLIFCFACEYRDAFFSIGVLALIGRVICFRGEQCWAFLFAAPISQAKFLYFFIYFFFYKQLSIRH